MMRLAVVPAALALALLTACGSSGGSGDAAPSATATDDLAGTSWTLTSYAGGAGTKAVPVPAGVGATATFADDRIGGSTGCNSYGGPYTASGGSIEVGALVSTKKACAGAAGRVEGRFIPLLDAATAYSIVGSSLTMSGPGGGVLLSFAAATAVPLVGTSWTATSINNGKQAVVSVVAGSTVTAEFAKDGTLSGNAGCNSYSGPYTLDGDTLTIGELASTLVGCEPAISAQESAYLAALGRVTTFSITGNQLELRDDKGALQAAYSGK